MSKIICDICGTTYQDSAECCPICGFTNDSTADTLGEEANIPEGMEEIKGKKGRFSNKKRREIFDFDEVNSGARPSADEGNPYEEEEEYEEEPPRRNTLMVVFLTVLIVLLLAAAAFLFLRFYLPGTDDAEETTAATVAPIVTEAIVDTTELTIPCESLVLTSGTASGDAELVEPGQKFLLNVIATPADTTDKIIYQSHDESIATVDADGHVVAVGEGETVIMISCGDKQIPCKVVCNFSKEEETTAATVAETVAETTASAGTKKDVTLKLKKSDIMLKVYYAFQLVLDCDLAQNEVEWSSEHPYIATVDEEGNVTAVQAGTTEITAKYGDQTVSCIIRCHN